VGLNVVEAYGMTESSALITANRPWENRLGSVGKAIPKTEMKTAGDGEVLTRGPHVSQGYYKNEMATRKTIDENGWLHTGDMGKIDEDGFLWITDRKKDILITAAGKNVAPQNIENLMKTSKYVSQFMVFGDRRKYLVGLLTLDEDEVTKYARDRQLIYSDLKELSQLLEINDLISSEVLRLNGKLASYETIKMFRILEEELSQDDDEVTPTLKVKRNVIEKRYGHLIEEMYGVKR
jgi:long-chain acyl-CoA synthetase